MKNKHFPEIKGKFGFGCMRFPTLENGEIDIPQVKQMFDAFLDAGFNYFDTAHGYHNGKRNNRGYNGKIRNNKTLIKNGKESANEKGYSTY
jgi:predicted aldo/keto reductase-like oxidoreductase